MTPRHADIAFVLEGVPGVRDVYAFDRPGRAAVDLAFAVRLEHGGRPIALAHYALLRVLTHAECKSVIFFEVELPPALRAHATRLELSPAEREEARARIPVTSEALQQPPAPSRVEFRVLVVDADKEVDRILGETFGVAVERVVEPNPFEAFVRTWTGNFDLIVCDARLAFGGNGFLRRLHAADTTAASRVVLLAHEGERDLLVAGLDELQCWSSFLLRPIDGETLREILHTGSVIQSWRMPVPAAAGGTGGAGGAVTSEASPVPLLRRVLVVDDDPTTAMLLSSMQGAALDVTVTSDEWEALDAIAAGAPELVVCSVSLQTRGGTPFYRLLWNAHPELKQRFVFIARADAAPASTSSGRAAPVVARPLTRAVISELLARFSVSS